jgi:hypothetical protein
MTSYVAEAERIRRELDALLADWQEGRRGAREVWEGAEALWAAYDWEPVPGADEAEPVAEVAGLLESLPYQYVVPDDVGVLRRFLHAPAQELAAAWQEWTRYWESIDFPRRAADLSADPLYAFTEIRE